MIRSIRRVLGIVSPTSASANAKAVDAYEPRLVISVSSRDSLVQRAAILYEDARLPEAERLEREALVVSKYLDGEWHTETLKVKAGLAITLRGQAKFVEALELGEDIVKAHSLLRGPADQATRIAIESLFQTKLMRAASQARVLAKLMRAAHDPLG